MLSDTHAHLTKEGISLEQIQQHLLRAQEAGVTRVINIATTPYELERGLALKKDYPWVDHVGATPPHDVLKLGERDFSFFEAHAKEGHLVAIGETGLDYHYYAETQEIQKHFLKKYLTLAMQCHLPVVIHCRDAFADLFSLLDVHYQGKVIMHCFTGNKAEAEEVIKRRWYLSLSGIVTFKKSAELQDVAKMVPLQQLLIETDAPYLAPHPMRGKTNEPSFLVHTATYLAQLRGLSLEELAQITTANAAECFQ